MTELQIRVLIECARDIQSIEALATRFGVQRQTVSRALAALTEKGYVTGDGAKARWFRVTVDGENALYAVRNRINDALGLGENKR